MWSNRAAWHIKFPAKWSWDQVTLLIGLERKCIVGKPEDQLFFFLITKLMMICDYEPPHFLQVGHLHQIISLKTWVSETNEKWGNFHDPSYSNWYDMRIPANFFLVKFVRYLPCHGRNYPKFPSDVRRFPTIFRRLSECGRKRPKMFRRTLTTSEAI